MLILLINHFLQELKTRNNIKLVKNWQHRCLKAKINLKAEGISKLEEWRV